jgi:twinkle protein
VAGTTKTFSDFGIDLPSGASGDGVHVICPQCGGDKRTKRENRRDKDLSVNTIDGTWLCHHCGWSGGLGQKTYERPREIEPIPDHFMQKVYDWFAARGISEHVVRSNHIGLVRGQRDWIAFPYYRRGQHINTTYRTLDGEKDFRQEKGAERILYGLDHIHPEAKTMLICEGQVDKMSFDQAGIPNCVSVPDGALNPGTEASDTKFTYLASESALFARMERVYLACDSDAPGQTLRDELARRIGREKCWIVSWPDGIKDANEALTKIGPAAIVDAVAKARPFPIQGLWYGDQLEEDVIDLYQHGYDPGVRIGYDHLDDIYRPRKGLVTIVTGWSSHGKSTWLDHIMVKMAETHGWKFAIFSPENQPIREHIARLLEIHVGKGFDPGVGNRMTERELMMAQPFINEHFTFILPEIPKIDTILELASTALLQHGINGLIIDPWNEIEHMRPGGMNETEYISMILSKIRRFARVNDIHVWVLAHPAKPHMGQSIKEAPELHHISGSNNWWNKCDYGISIWREPGDNSIWSQCHVKKVRFKPTGKVGIVDFRVDYRTRHMETREHEDEQ